MLIDAGSDYEVEQMLAPYDENSSAESIWTPVSGGELEDMAKFYSVPNEFDALAPHAQSYFGAELIDSGGQIGYNAFYNPNGKWDWYAIGGRWSGFLPLKEGSGAIPFPRNTYPMDGSPLPEKCADSALKGDIDWEGARFVAAQRANKYFKMWEEAVAKHGMPPEWDSALANKLSAEGKLEEYRQQYFDDPRVTAIKEVFPANEHGWMFNAVEEFKGHTLLSYVEQERTAALTCYATITHDEGWIAPGDMGWFGMSSDGRADRAAYTKKVYDIIESLADDTPITIVDCHS
jgi:hypothetical protein